MSACALAALARIAKLIASRTSSSLAPFCLAPARSRFAQWVLPAARLAARYQRAAGFGSSAPFLYFQLAMTFSSSTAMVSSRSVFQVLRDLDDARACEEDRPAHGIHPGLGGVALDDGRVAVRQLLDLAAVAGDH